MGLNYKVLLEDYNAEVARGGVKAGRKYVANLFSKKDSGGQLNPYDCDLGALFENIFGHRAFERAKFEETEGIREIMEAAGATGVNAFTNITGQIIYSAIIPKYEDEEFVFTKMIPTVDTKLDGEKIAGITKVGDEALEVAEGEEFPLAGPTETYINTPPTKKRGFRSAVTKEAVFFDRTGVLMDRFGDSATELGRNKEKRAINTVIDENGGAVSAMVGGHRYHWRGTSIQTYANNSGTHSWDNLEASNALVDYTDVEKAWLLLKAMKDPDINEPINIVPKHLIVTPQNFWTANRIKHATMTGTHVDGYATSGNLVEFRAPSPIPFDLEILSTQLLADQLGTDTSWFMGDISKAFRYMQNWPIQVRTAPATAEDDFKRDIVFQVRCDERGAFSTWEPRFVTKNTA